MSNLLLAESGSTKTDWCLVRKKGKPVHFRTSGINPYLQSPDLIASLLEQELVWDGNRHQADSISFYVAGAGSATNQKSVSQVLKRHFGIRKVEVQGDMMAAARALCGDRKGVVCILGTGSNSCYYNGKTI